jgi:hypothetical protein
MREGHGFSYNPIVPAKNNPRWALLHTYSLLKLPKICGSKIHESGPSNKVM